jgi:hypothetical protein
VIPGYAVQNYFAICQNFPKYEVWFVVDDKKNHERLQKQGINSWLAPRQVSPSLSGRSTYRNGFWINTTNRFLAMNNFHQSKGDLSLLQVESDVILTKQFPMDSFLEINKRLAYPLSSPDVGLASTLWCKDSEATSYLAEFALKCISENSLVTDTDILGLLVKSIPEDVLVLRSGLDDLSVYRDNTSKKVNSLSGSEHPINNHGVFDASSLGIHLCGSDPRNSFGVSKVFGSLPHHFTILNALNFNIQDDKIFLSTNRERRLIYSLHNHSKSSRYFSGDFVQLLSMYLWRRKNGEFVRFSFRGFSLCVIDYLQLAKNRIKRVAQGVGR